MTTIITRHYPALNLPAELREGIDPFSLVTVTIIQRAPPDSIPDVAQPADLTEGVSENLRSQRDERDE
jgi:hypothetical protein